MAIGIMTFALLVIFSLVPTGLSVLQDANRQIVETEIYRTVGAELASTPFDKLEDYVSARFPLSFDNDGIEVTGGEPVFIVRCSLAAPELGAGELRRATVWIGYHRDPDAAGGGKVERRTFLLVNRGGEA